MPAKLYVLSLVIALAFSSCAHYKRSNSLHDKNLKGRVKSATILQITYNAIPQDTATTTEEFDTAGNLLLQLNYSLGTVFKSQYTYDDQGLMATDKSYKNGALVWNYSNRYTIDMHGRKTEQFIYAADGKLISKNKFKYDYKYDEIELANYTPGDTLYAKTTNKYDLKGDKIQVLFYKSANSYASSTITYDTSHDRLQVTTIEKDSVLNINSSTTYVWKHSNYDKAGNWLREEVYVNGQLRRVAIRTFAYY